MTEKAWWWRDTIQVVLLDEMNLSHPEQYFSDLLSTLELRAEDQHLEIMTHSVAAAPALFDGGGKLHIPPNVWFVGTANHYETTMDFADKTYDRSHVMEFPVRPEEFKEKETPPRRAISFSALQCAFKEARRRHHDSAEKAIGFLDSKVRDGPARDFDVGWGPGILAYRPGDACHPGVDVTGGSGVSGSPATGHARWVVAGRLRETQGFGHGTAPSRRIATGRREEMRGSCSRASGTIGASARKTPR